MLEISSHSLNDSIVFKCVSLYNPIFLIPSIVSECSPLSKSLVLMYRFMTGLGQSVSQPVYHRIRTNVSQIEWLAKMLEITSHSDRLFVLSWHFYNQQLLLSIVNVLKRWEQCQCCFSWLTQWPTFIFLSLSWEGILFGHLSRVGDINARVSQLIVIQCQCQIRQHCRTRIKTEPKFGFFLSACSYIRAGLPS